MKNKIKLGFCQSTFQYNAEVAQRFCGYLNLGLEAGTCHCISEKPENCHDVCTAPYWLFLLTIVPNYCRYQPFDLLKCRSSI